MSFTLANILFSGVNPAEQYYRELNCKPIVEPGESEPSRYDCSKLIKHIQVYLDYYAQMGVYSEQME